MQPFYLYILKCSDGSYYTGHTDNIEKRISEHTLGVIKGYTSKRLPVKVVYVVQFASRYEAIAAERKIKGWSRKKKKAFICNDWKKINKYDFQYICIFFTNKLFFKITRRYYLPQHSPRLWCAQPIFSIQGQIMQFETAIGTLILGHFSFHIFNFHISATLNKIFFHGFIV